MEMIIFIGIPASGKSSFYKANFFTTHMRISLDLFNTRNKEHRLMDTALHVQQRMVIDNTNVSRHDRSLYIVKAKARRYRIIGYYFRSPLQECMQRNAMRQGKEHVAHAGLLAKYRQLEEPVYDEGYDALYAVDLINDKVNINAIEP